MQGYVEPLHDRAFPWFVRRGLDVVVASFGLVVLGIPMLAISLAVRLTSAGPALLRQSRVGLAGELFTLYKFRTMRVGGSDHAHRDMIARELRGENVSSNGSWKLDADPRVTRIGGWLRRTSLDELPQLLNVLGGEMTLVGPRPCLKWEARMFPTEYDARFAVRPGLTGLWQVTGRSTMGTLDMLQLDVEFVQNRTLGAEWRILSRTIPALLRGGGAR